MIVPLFLYTHKVVAIRIHHLQNYGYCIFWIYRQCFQYRVIISLPTTNQSKHCFHMKSTPSSLKKTIILNSWLFHMAFMACIRKYVSEFFLVHALQTPVYTQYTRTITVKKKTRNIRNKYTKSSSFSLQHQGSSNLMGKK